MSNTPSLSRRDFVKSTAAVATAATAIPALASSLLVSRTAHVAGSDTLKVGLIGCGGRGTGAALQALTADKGAVLWAMGDVFKDRLESSLSGLAGELGDEAGSKLQVAEERKFLGFDSYKAVIDSGVDVVLLTSYPAFRPAHFQYAVAAGKHIFCEKPMGVDAPGHRLMRENVEIARQKNLAVVAGFCWRYHDAMQAAFDALHNGVIGDITGIHTTYHTSTLSARPRQAGWSDLEWQMRNWWHFTWISGDHIVEQAVHSIDRMAWALKDKTPVLCNALGGRAARTGPESGHVFDHFTVIYEYDNGVRGFHTCRQIDGCPSDNTDYVYGTKGRMTINGWTPENIEAVDYAGKSLWKYSGRLDRDMYQNEHDELFASIRSGKPINNGTRMVNSSMLAVMGRMSAYTGQTITWDQAWNSKEDLTPAGYDFKAAMAVPPVAVPGKTPFI